MSKIEQMLKSLRSESQQLEQDKRDLNLVRINCIFIQCTNFYFQSYGIFVGHFRNPKMLIFYWVFWVVITLVLLVSHYKQKPHLIRLCHHLIMVRNIIPWLNIEDRKTFDNYLNRLVYNQMQAFGTMALMVVWAIEENISVHLPISIIYQTAICFGQFFLLNPKGDFLETIKYNITKS